ncbi:MULTISPECIES: helix-turn-helix domain-containing protein [unclassified Nonomuraea]|uniref:helix-turn-helix domain-containing protein n=1 Tax=unclassified Nonomuraea TaxID=2593643 RepID=UPI0033E6CB0B
MPKLLFARAPRDESEERDVRRLAGARHAPGDWIQRARIVVASWDGLRVPAIAAKLGCHPETVRRRLHRFNGEGIDGLGDRPGPGRRPRLTESERSHIIALVKTTPPGRPMLDLWLNGLAAAEEEDAPGVWTLDTLTTAARAAGIQVGRSQVRRILLTEGVRWRRPRSWTTSKDPKFAAKDPGSWTSLRARRPAG